MNTLILEMSDCMTNIGMPSYRGFTKKELLQIKKSYEKKVSCEYVDFCKLGDMTGNAGILILRKGVDYFLKKISSNSEKMHKELCQLKMTEKVCLADFDQKNYIHKNGTCEVRDFNNTPSSSFLRKKFEKVLNLTLVGEIIDDVAQNSEKKIIIGIVLGKKTKKSLRWYRGTQKISKKITVKLFPGDIYFFSKRAVGYQQSEYMLKME